MSRRTPEKSYELFLRMEGRGDVMSIPVEKGSELAALPKEMFAEILYPLFRWWIYNDKTEPTDPRDKMVFAGLKTHQIENAIKRGETLKAWIENSRKGGRPKSNKKPSGNQKETKRKPSGHSVDRVQDEEQVNSSSSLSTLSTGEGSPQVVATPAATPPSIEDARQWLDEYAPPCTSNDEFYSDDERRTPKGLWPHVYLRASAEEAAEKFLEKLPKVDDSLAECFLNHTLDEMQLGEGTIQIGGENLTHNEIYKRVMLHSYCEDAPDEDDAEGQIYTFRRIFQAVKKCHQMLDVIAGSSDNVTSVEDY